MKKLFILLFVSIQVYAQPDTEVYVLDLTTDDGKIEMTNLKNISNNEGYDNQPSFYNNSTVLFSSTRNGQTDIAQYSFGSGELTWISNTPNGSEYSPLKIPDKKTVSAIRLDKDGTQLLYQYEMVSGKPQVLLQDLKVGYHLWYSKNIIVSSVLVENRMDLVVSNIRDKSNYTLQKNVGRSLHKIPNSDLISYISKETKVWEIKSLDPVSRATKKIIEIPGEVQDMCWLRDGTILTGQGNTILKYRPGEDKDWSLLKTFTDKNINNITRLATNRASSHLALVAEISPESIVQKQLDAYNARNIEGFLATYADDIKLYNYPDQLFSEGKKKMRETYGAFFDATPDLHAEIKNRIVIGNKVIDEEYVTMNGNSFSAVAVYEVENGKIAKVTFIQ